MTQWGWHPRRDQTRRRAFKKILFDLIRPLFVRGWDRNEDFICGNCGEPVLRRWLFCSPECCRHHEHYMESIAHAAGKP